MSILSLTPRRLGERRWLGACARCLKWILLGPDPRPARPPRPVTGDKMPLWLRFD